MDMEISFPGGVAVDARYNGLTIRSDQPVASGGAGSAPAPFDLFLASIGTCAGFYALRFCQERRIDTNGMKIALAFEWIPAEKRISKIRIDVTLPGGFPEKYRQAVVRAIDQCTVKRHILVPPEFEIALL